MSKNIFTTEGIDNPPLTVEQMLEGRIQLNRVPSDSGLFNTSPPLKHPEVVPSPDEFRLSNHGASIAMRRDRPNSLASGYGAKGGQRCATIDFCVGPGSAMRKGEGPKNNEKINPNFGTDAARIYLSQLTDADSNFGLAGEPIKGRSACVMKADRSVIIGREGIKIVTGKMQGGKFGGGSMASGERNSLGAKITRPAPGIDLLAGNNSGSRIVFGGISNPRESIDYLQPVTLGTNTRDALREIKQIIDEIWSAIFALTISQMLFNCAIAIDPFRPWVPSAFPGLMINVLNWVLNSLYHTRTNVSLWKISYTTPAGYKYICSRNVRST